MACASVGVMELSDADDANIPVNIFITKGEDEEDESEEEAKLGEWVLTADNFMPRRGRTIENAFKYRGDSPEELRALVNEFVLQRYRKAVELIEKMIAGNGDSFYYWG
jgi:phosphopantothenate synthetase